MLQTIFEATKNANSEIISYLNSSIHKSDFLYINRGFGGDLSSQIDQFCESIFVKHLLQFGDIFSEESGLIVSTSDNKIKNARFIIDPLDGSDNFLSNLPYFGSSVALAIDDVIVFAMITNFVNGQMTYRLNNTFWCNGLSNATIAIFERSYANPLVVQKLNQLGIKFRSPGAVALSLANARFYSFVLFYGNLREFDLAAARFINQDLYTYENETFVLVAHDKLIFEKIKAIL